MAQHDDDITPAILLQHMRGMEQRLDAKIESVRKELRSDINQVEHSLGRRINRLERKVDLISVQIGNIDERLDDIEVVQIPMLKKAAGIS